MTVGSRFLTLWTNANSHHVGITYQKSDLRWANMPLRTVPLRLWRISQGYLNTRSWNLVQEGSSLSISKDSEKYTCNHICAHITLPRHMLYSYVISFNDSTTKLKHYQYRRIGTFGHFTKFDTRQIFHYTIYVYVCVLQLTVHLVYILYMNVYSLQQYGDKQLRVNLAYRGGRGGRGRGGPGRGGPGRGELIPPASVCVWQPSGVQ